MARLARRFYKEDSTLEISKKLLGKFVVRKWKGRKLTGKIVETEAYIGPEDKAAHSYKGKVTKRTKIEYEEGGYIYIYLVYGMYWQFNIVTKGVNQPECILLRAIEPISAGRNSFKENSPNEKIIREKDKKEMKLRDLTNGPGKLCMFLKLDGSFYGEDLVNSERIWLEDRGVKVKNSEIASGARIGIDYAGKYWANKPWRFYIKDNPFVSKAR